MHQTPIRSILTLDLLLLNLKVKSGDKVKVVELLDKICKDKLEPFIEKSYQDLADYVSPTNKR